jgi:hypothetical protein
MDYLSSISFMLATCPDHLGTVTGSSGEATGLLECVRPALPISSDQATGLLGCVRPALPISTDQASPNPIPASVIVPYACFDRSRPIVFCNNIVIYSVNNTTMYIGNQY